MAGGLGATGSAAGTTVAGSAAVGNSDNNLRISLMTSSWDRTAPLTSLNFDSKVLTPEVSKDSKLETEPARSSALLLMKATASLRSLRV